jgi:hypothetical protein
LLLTPILTRNNLVQVFQKPVCVAQVGFFYAAQQQIHGSFTILNSVEHRNIAAIFFLEAISKVSQRDSGKVKS